MKIGKILKARYKKVWPIRERKWLVGDRISAIEAFARIEASQYVFWRGKAYHPAVLRSMTLHTLLSGRQEFNLAKLNPRYGRIMKL